jgi:hypothetical protein
MIKNRQGILHLNRLRNLITVILCLITLFFTQAVYSEPAAKPAAGKNITLIYSTDSSLQHQIATGLKNILTKQDSSLDISEIKKPEQMPATGENTDLVVVIDFSNLDLINSKFQHTQKLFIASNPARFNPGDKAEKRSAVLFMTQPYCRQVQFIRLIDGNWQTIGYLNNRNTPLDSSDIEHCADKYKMNTYKHDITPGMQLTHDIKDVLSRSDLLLAIPDKDIYNSKTVKNILLTSYRHRKPLIAFSKNFVDAGALASIYSTTEQITQSAATLVTQFFNESRKFKKQINYPELYELSFNRQVYRALDLRMPDPLEVKQALESSKNPLSGIKR